MNKIDITGKIFNYLKIINELGNNRVIAQCLLCGTIKEFSRGNILKGFTKSCGCKKSFRDRTGQQFGNMLILVELGHNKVIARCLLCETDKPYNKNSIVCGDIKSCGCATRKYYQK